MAKRTLPKVGYLVSYVYPDQDGFDEYDNRGCFRTMEEAQAYAAKLQERLDFQRSRGFGMQDRVEVAELDLVERRAAFRAMGERAGRSFWKDPL